MIEHFDDDWKRRRGSVSIIKTCNGHDASHLNTNASLRSIGWKYTLWTALSANNPDCLPCESSELSKKWDTKKPPSALGYWRDPTNREFIHQRQMIRSSILFSFSLLSSNSKSECEMLFQRMSEWKRLSWTTFLSRISIKNRSSKPGLTTNITSLLVNLWWHFSSKTNNIRWFRTKCVA